MSQSSFIEACEALHREALAVINALGARATKAQYQDATDDLFALVLAFTSPRTNPLLRKESSLSSQRVASSFGSRRSGGADGLTPDSSRAQSLHLLGWEGGTLEGEEAEEGEAVGYDGHDERRGSSAFWFSVMDPERTDTTNATTAALQTRSSFKFRTDKPGMSATEPDKLGTPLRAKPPVEIPQLVMFAAQDIMSEHRKSLARGASMCSRSFVDAAGEFHMSDKLEKRKDDDGFKTLNEYSIVQEIGRGSFGKVKLGVTKTGEARAIKCLKKKSLLKRVGSIGGLNALQMAQKEIAIMKKLKHKNIVALHEVIDDPEHDTMYLVMQYVPHGAVVVIDPTTQTCAPVPPLRIRRYVRHLSAALIYTHNHGVVHRDIKPENVLIGDGDTPYLVDFGVSDLVDQSRDDGTLPTFGGTPAFMAPEMFSTDDGSEIDFIAGDVWALGVTVYAMLFGRLPFAAPTHAELAKAIMSSEPNWEAAPESRPTDADEARVFDDLVSLVADMLNKNPVERATLREVQQHPALIVSDDSKDLLSPSGSLRRVHFPNDSFGGGSNEWTEARGDASIKVSLSDLEQAITAHGDGGTVVDPSAGGTPSP